MIITNVFEQITADISSDIEIDIRCDNIEEKDVSDEEIEADDLEQRIWKDQVKLKRIKIRKKLEAEKAAQKQKPKHPSNQAQRKKMSRAQDGILKYMLKLMEVCKARGFVYGIIPEKGKAVSGSSDNIRAWWKEKVKFDKNGPAAIAKYDADILALCEADNNQNESAIWLGVLGREESLYRQPSIENGASSLTENPAGNHSGKKQHDVGSDSDYDVGGVDDGVGSVSSKDGQIVPILDAEPISILQNDTVQDKENQHKKKRKREKSTHAKQKKPSLNKHAVQPQLTNNLPDINQYDGRVLENQMNSTQNEDIGLADLRHSDKGQSQIRTTELQHLSAAPPAIPLRTQDPFVNGRPMIYPSVHNPVLQHGETFPYFDLPVDYQAGPHQMRSEDGRSHVIAQQSNGNGNGNETEIISGGFNFVEEPYIGEQDNRPAVDMNFASPIDNLSLDFDILSPFNFTESMDPLGDLLRDDDELISYFAS
ncbi:hypothetical protein ACFE04_028441 [Oxalis oulophora]